MLKYIVKLVIIIGCYFLFFGNFSYGFNKQEFQKLVEKIRETEIIVKLDKIAEKKGLTRFEILSQIKGMFNSFRVKFRKSPENLEKINILQNINQKYINEIINSKENISKVLQLLESEGKQQDGTNKYQEFIDLIKQSNEILVFDAGGNSLIHQIINLGDIELLKKILKIGINLDMYNKNSDTGLILSAGKVNDLTGFNIAKILLSYGADVNLINKNNSNSPLLVSIQSQNTGFADMILKYGPALDIQNLEGDTALISASKNKFRDLVKKIIELSGDVNIRNNEQNTAPVYFVLDGDIEMIKYFVENGYEIDKYNAGKKTLLMLACGKGFSEIVEYLLKKGASVNIQDFQGISALMYAAGFGDEKSTKLLLEKKADVELVDEFGKTALIYAALNGKSQSLIPIVDKKAKLDIQDLEQKNALIYASIAGDLVSVKYLLKNNADLDLVDLNGYSALLFACEKNFVEIVEALVTKGANLDIRDKNGLRSALLISIEQKFLGITKLLIDQSDVNLVNINNQTPLMIGASNGNVKGIQELLKQPLLDINLKDNSGKTALHYATIAGNIEIVKLLLAAGIDYSIQMSSGETALILAQTAKNLEIMELIEEQMKKDK